MTTESIALLALIGMAGLTAGLAAGDWWTGLAVLTGLCAIMCAIIGGMR